MALSSAERTLKVWDIDAKRLTREYDNEALITLWLKGPGMFL